jgi:RNA recognition motif-containing protein
MELFVQLTQEQILQLFQRFPGVQYCDLKTNKQTGDSKGYGFVGYQTIQQAKAARDALNGMEYPPGI